MSAGGSSPPARCREGPRPWAPRPADRPVSADGGRYASTLQEALVPLVADHKCSSPEVYGADISPNMLCAGYFDCKSDACQVSPSLRPAASEGTPPRGASRGQDRERTPGHCQRPRSGAEGHPSQEQGH